MNQIDLTKITDVKELKSLAYDQLAVLEAARANLTAINQRLNQLANPEVKEEVKAE